MALAARANATVICLKAPDWFFHDGDARGGGGISVSWYRDWLRKAKIERVSSDDPAQRGRITLRPLGLDSAPVTFANERELLI